MGLGTMLRACRATALALTSSAARASTAKISGEDMKARKIAGLALACAVALGVAQPVSAGLKIDLVYIDKPPPFYVAGGGQLREIMQVAAENWERALKTGNGNWKLKIEFGWDALRDPTFFAQEHLVGEGHPSRIRS